MDKHMKKGEYQRELARRNRARKRMWNRIHYVALFLIVLLFVAVVIQMISEKKKLRDEAIELYQQQDYLGALSRFDAAFAEKQWFSDSVDADILLYRADCLIHLQEYVEAGETCKRIKNQYSDKYYDSKQLDYMIELSGALEKYRQGDYVSTAATFVRAVENGHEEISIYAALCYENQKNYEKMKEYLDIYAGVNGMDSFMCYKYASYFYAVGDYASAVAYLGQGEACEDKEYLQKILYAKIMCYVETLNFDMAYNLANQYVAAYPDDAAGRDIRAYLDTRVNIDEVPINDRFHLFDNGDDNMQTLD